MKTYLGLKERSKPALFKSELEPTKETHPQYDIIYGPFRSKEDAEGYIHAMGAGVACGEG